MTTIERPTIDTPPAPTPAPETPTIIARVAINQPPQLENRSHHKPEVIIDTTGKALGIIIGGHALLNAGFGNSNEQPRLTGLPSTSVIGGFRSKAE